MAQNKTVLVIGATGKQGGATLRHLKTSGWHVRALTRDVNKPVAVQLASSGVDVFKGDMDNPSSLLPAMKGVQAVFSVQNWRDAEGREIAQGKAVVDAAKSAGVRHLVYTSAGGADQKTGASHLEDKGEIENYLRSSGVPYTVIRPVAFMDNFATSGKTMASTAVFFGTMDSHKKMQWVCVDDIGKIAALAFNQPDKFIGKLFEIASDEMTMPQAAEIFSKILGKRIVYQQKPIDESDQENAKRARFVNDHGYHADVPMLRKLVPDLTSLETFVKKKWASA
ncbi:MAG: NmrA/HSCARG family protein [Dehalococcoidia bacterium]|nr:NmrA/HSCARG family protein [Dehalococcoidia bacterium]